jgi:uncharacterized protein DUF6916
MHAPGSPPAPTARFTRRRLVQVGAAGAATAWLGGFDRLEGVARAAVGAHPELRRSTYLGLSTPTFQVAGESGSRALQLVSVEDLPVAHLLPGMRGRDDAFSVRFRGGASEALPQGTHTMSHPQLGRFELFIAPVDQAGDTQDYEAVVDRTVRIPGLDEDGAPDPVTPPRARREVAERGALGRSGEARQARSVRLLKTSLQRTPRVRRLLARVTLGGQADVVSVHALLVRNGRVLAQATSAAGRSQHRLRFDLRSAPRYRRYRLVLTVIDRDGNVTRLSRVLRLPRSR